VGGVVCNKGRIWNQNPNHNNGFGLGCVWCVVVSFFFLNLDGLEKKRDKQHVLSVVGVGVGGNEGTRELEPKQMAVDGEMMEE
jgi:hypothetical protein